MRGFKLAFYHAAGIVSGNNVLDNNLSKQGFFAASGVFSVHSLYATAKQTDGMVLLAQSFRFGLLVDTVNITLVQTGPRLLGLPDTFHGIRRVRHSLGLYLV